MTKAEQAYEYYITNKEATKELSAKKFEIATITLTRYMKKMGYETKESGIVKLDTTNRKKRENKPHGASVLKEAYDLMMSGEPLDEVKKLYPICMVVVYAKKHNLPIRDDAMIERREDYTRDPKLVKEALEWKEKTGDTYREASERFGASLDAIKQQAYLKRKSQNKKGNPLAPPNKLV